MTIDQQIDILEWRWEAWFGKQVMELVDDVLLFTDKMGWRTELLSFPQALDEELNLYLVAVCRIWVDPTNLADSPVLYKGKGESRFRAALSALTNLALDLPNGTKGQL